MAEQQRRKVRKAGDEQITEEDVAATPRAQDTSERIDDLLDEIDSVLEENAEEFVKNYVQKGGE